LGIVFLKTVDIKYELCGYVNPLGPGITCGVRDFQDIKDDSVDTVGLDLYWPAVTPDRVLLTSV